MESRMTKLITDYSKEVQSLWIAHEALLRLGFQPDDIYVGRHIEGCVEVVDCTLKTQKKQFVVNCGVFRKAIFSEWGDLVDRNNRHEFSLAEKNALFLSWPFPQSRTEFISALVMKGFVLPYSVKKS